MNVRFAVVLALASALLPSASLAQTTAAPSSPSAASAPPRQTPAPADAKLYFISPVSGARVRGPFVVQFGLRNMGVTQAGVTTPNTGHHHIIVDGTSSLDPNEPIPADKNHIHYGGGQTEAKLDLPPGRHTLQLVLGDAWHRPFEPVISSDKIVVTVLGPKRQKRGRPARYRRYGHLDAPR